MSNGLEKYPKLRFPGFEEPWTETAFSSFSAINPKSENLPDKFIYIDLESVLSGELQSEKIEFAQTAPSRAQRTLIKNDVLFQTVRPYQQNNYFYTNTNINNLPCVASTGYAVFRTKNNAKFLYALIHTNSFLADILKRCTGSNYPSINGYDIENITIFYPSLQEQEKIGDFMSLIDKKIRKTKLLIKALKKYKRGVSKAIFTQKISLSGCRNTWYRCNLADAITLQSGQDFPPYDYNDKGEGIPYMTGASCIEDGLTVVSRWTTTPKCFAYKGDTLLVCKGSGSGAVVKLTQEKVHIARQFMALRANDKMTQNFCFFLIEYLSDKMKRAATGLIEGIDRKTVLDQSIILPSIWEQEKIAKFLSCIVNKITQESVCLSQIEQLKKSLLQQLFI